MKVPKIDTRPFVLFLDLDGVFSDFNRRVYDLSGKQPFELGNKLWKIIMADKQFFASLELMKDAEYLWEYVKQYDPTFLTGAPPGERSRTQKREWVAKKFGDQYTTIVLPKKDKQLHSGPHKVLVDDTQINIDQWIDKGGHGVFHRDVWETIDRLEEIRGFYRE